MFVKPGARITKTVLAVVTSMLFAYFITGNYSAIAPISAVVTLKESTQDSITTGLERIIGTVFGSVLSLVYIYTSINFFDLHNFIILTISTGVLSFISLWINKSLKFGAGSAANSVILIIIVLNGYFHNTDAIILNTIHRTIETSIGIICAVLINRYIYISSKK
ncbi:MAG: hypothetical protein GX675_05095 [Erysipelotrichaceae bacterium]|nr:hypothetical protein [Erysipelotrichaceae bacterium]